MPVDTISRDTLLGKRLYFVLRLRIANADYYLSTDTISIVTDDGDAIQVIDGIEDVDWESALDLFGDSPQAVSIPFSVVIPNLNVGELISRGIDLSSATGQLSRWVEGETWESRQVLVTGEITEPSHGGVDEPINFSLSQAPFDDRSSMISPDAVIDEAAWPDADEKAYGNTYPQVFGAPGRISSSAKVAGSPGYIVDTSNLYLLIAGHEVNATSVYVKNIDNGTDWASRSVSHTTDGRGRTVAIATLSSGAGDGQYNSSTAGNEYMVSWSADGGRYNRRRDASLTRAGDMLDYWLDLTTLRVDQGRTAAAAELLNGFLLSGYADEDTSVWDWIKSNLLPILPVSIVAGPNGLYPIVWPYEAVEEDAVATIDVDRLDAERTSEVQYSPVADIANEIRVAYALDLETDNYARQIRATGDDTYTSQFDDTFYGISVLRASRSRYGVAVEALETDIVYDQTTASKVATWVSYANATTTRTVTYLLPSHYRWLALGDVVTITDSEIVWTDQLCWIESIEDADVDQIQITVRTIERPTDPKN